MKLNLEGRVRNTTLPKSKSLWPVLEALVNSFQAIEAARTDKPYIHIRLHRDNDALTEAWGRITSVEIIDNGIGFNGPNLESFNTSDSDYKRDLGGKGIGRFLWLKAFAEVAVESVFVSENGLQIRKFAFTAKEGVTGMETQPTSAKEPRTVVRLVEMKAPYKDSIPSILDTLAEHVIEHCLPLFLLPAPPRVTISDGIEEKNLTEIFRKEYDYGSPMSSFEVRGQKFTVRGFKLRHPTEKLHKLIYAANHRGVITERLDQYVINLKSRVTDDRGAFFYVGFVQSEFLDNAVNSERTDFAIPKEQEDDPRDRQVELLEDVGQESSRDPALDEIRAGAIGCVRHSLQGLFGRIDEQKKRAAETFVEKEAPWYRFVLKSQPGVIDKINPQEMSLKALDLIFHEEIYRQEREVRLESARLLHQAPGAHDSADYAEQFRRLMNRINDLGKSTLTQHVVHRKIVLDFLEQNLRRSETNGRYSLEDVIHDLIHPRHTTSDDVPFEKQNLWLLDERLAYHHYLTSDKPLRANQKLENNSRYRPDILIFDRPFVFGDGDEPLASMVVVEFKKPGRASYVDEDPTEQVVRIVREIRSGRYIDENGRPVQVAEGRVKAYGYVVCELIDPFKAKLLGQDWEYTSDGGGLFRTFKNLNIYIEVISYNKLINDARRRSRVLFEKLGISW